MSLYSIDKLIEETRRVASEFRNTTGTMLPVSAEIARYDVVRLLEFTTIEDRNTGYDAIGSGRYKDMKILIKSRIIKDHGKSSHRIGQLNSDSNWDMIALSLMNEDFEPVEIYIATREEIEDAIGDKANSRSKRGAMSVAKFMIISELVWTDEIGRCDWRSGTTDYVSAV